MRLFCQFSVMKGTWCRMLPRKLAFIVATVFAGACLLVSRTGQHRTGEMDNSIIVLSVSPLAMMEAQYSPKLKKAVAKGEAKRAI